VCVTHYGPWSDFLYYDLTSHTPIDKTHISNHMGMLWTVLFVYSSPEHTI